MCIRDRLIAVSSTDLALFAELMEESRFFFTSFADAVVVCAVDVADFSVLSALFAEVVAETKLVLAVFAEVIALSSADFAVFQMCIRDRLYPYQLLQAIKLLLILLLFSYL